MGRNIAILVVVVLLVLGGYYFYKQYQAKRTLDNGAVQCQGCMTPEQQAAFDREDHGESPNAIPGPRSDAATTPAGYSTAEGSTVTNQPPAGSTAANANNQAMMETPASAPPTGDTIPPNPPNGMRFAGTGTYQWYREGNLTWRTNTATGASCIVYATMDEWRKPIVINHGCGRNA